jgi:hypothetical protein
MRKLAYCVGLILAASTALAFRPAGPIHAPTIIVIRPAGPLHGPVRPIPIRPRGPIK